jgi:tRNA-intron endonuclease
MPKKIEVEFIENFLVVWNPTEGSELYKMGFYGKPVGIPKPKVPEFRVPLILDLMEGLYLAEKKIITIYEGEENSF